jgi:hypothetical protein
MVKFPSQNKMFYQTGTIGTNLTQITSGGTGGDLNLPKDLSILNRRGYASTTRKGVPLVYRCKVDYYLQDEDQNGISAAVGTDFASTLDIYGCQNNWVMRNAAVKWHAAWNKMWRDAGVKKSDLGAYAHEIRYCYDAASDTFVTPIDGVGNAFTGGTWDLSTLEWTADSSFQLRLVGAGDDEETDAFAGSVLTIGHSYLLSRANQQADTNLQTEEGPAKFSVLQEMLSPHAQSAISVADNVVGDARDDQDNPPYEVLDLSDSGDVNHDITEPVLLGRALASLGSGYGSVIVDIPFGLAGLSASVHDAAGTTVTSSGSICVEVLDIYEMQG